MKKIDKETLKEIAYSLCFDMSEEEYDKLLKEFDTINEQINLLSQVDGIDEVTPVSFPYEVSATDLREDEVDEELTQEEALLNSEDKEKGMIKVPKVVK